MPVIEIARIQVRRGQENITGMPKLDAGEFGWAQDTENLYIGKRIAEGAPDDENTRILTENDLTNIFSLIYGGGAIATTSTYKYRDTVPHINAQLSTVGTKLDALVSLTDYGFITTGTDITIELQNAVADLFFNQPASWDDWRRADARRQLKIPAGNYYISDTIDLPPYTSIVGEGPDLTILTFITSTDRPMFKTVDAEGNDWATGNMQSGAKRAREVNISDITLEYNDGLNTQFPLVSVDNALDSKFKNVYFRTKFDSTSTTTYGLTNYGTGISIRGLGGGIGSGDVNLCENIEIINCKFDGIYRAIEGTGTVVRATIKDNLFSNLQQGIKLYTIDSLPGPSNFNIVTNRFENIVTEGLYVGSNPNGIVSGHLSADNFYIQVGNGTGLDDFMTTSLGASPIIRFQTQGNKSVNDYFRRKHLANTTTDINFYYNPVVEGRVSLVDDSAYTATIVKNTVTPVAKLCINSQSQTVDVRYQLSNSGLSRAGHLLVNLSSDGYAALTDTYNFSEGMSAIVQNVTTTTDATTTTQFSVDTALFPEFADPTITDGTWYITGNNAYYGYAALITSLVTVLGTIYIFDTISNSPTFDFSVNTDSWSLLKSEAPQLVFQTDSSHISRNYIGLSVANASVYADYNLEYSINILS